MVLCIARCARIGGSFRHEVRWARILGSGTTYPPAQKGTYEVMSASSSSAARRGREDEAENNGVPSVVPETPAGKRSRRGAAQEEERKVDEAEESARAFPDGIPS